MNTTTQPLSLRRSLAAVGATLTVRELDEKIAALAKSRAAILRVFPGAEHPDAAIATNAAPQVSRKPAKKARHGGSWTKARRLAFGKLVSKRRRAEERAKRQTARRRSRAARAGHAARDREDD